MPENQPNPTNQVRLNRFIAQCGVASRRGADELIESGRVTINGHRVKEHGCKVDPFNDHVKVGNKLIKPEEELKTFMFHKPPSVMTTMKDPQGRITVADFFKDEKLRLFPVGRLDWDSEGLLIMTNDGDLTQKILHPSHEIPKTYLVKLNDHPTEKDLDKLRNGVSIVGGKAKADVVELLEKRGKGRHPWIKIIISEGRNRQIRRMVEKMGFDTMKLQRVAIGGLSIGPLKRGQYRQLTPKDIQRIFKKFEKAD